MMSDNFQKLVQNPFIPFTESLTEGLLPGELLVIDGFIPKDSDRFQIDFQCGSSIEPRADVAFHFNPRFKKSGCIVCNTLQQGRWGSEEITYEMPFEKGKPFEIVFIVLGNKFQVSVNGKFLLLYKHRINLEKINTLGIYGKVQVYKIGFSSNKSLQGSQPSLLVTPKTKTGNEAVSDGSQFVVPYTGRLNASLQPGQTIVIKGEVNEKANSFAVNLKASDSNDIALHLNPRLKDKAFVRNSYLDNSWGEEERHISHFPFCPGMYFELIIFCETHHYNIALNGVHILEYKHRFKQLGKISILEVCGDVQLLDVRSW